MTRDKTTREFRVKIAVATLIFISGLIWVFLNLLAFENSSFARVSWSEEGTPMVAHILVVDEHEVPVEGASIDIINDSGGNSGETAKDGTCDIELGEPEVLEIKLYGGTLVSRPWAGTFGTPNVSTGLQVKIKLTELGLRVVKKGTGPIKVGSGADGVE